MVGSTDRAYASTDLEERAYWSRCRDVSRLKPNNGPTVHTYVDRTPDERASSFLSFGFLMACETDKRLQQEELEQQINAVTHTLDVDLKM